MLRVRMSVCGTRGRRGGGGVACVRAWCVQLPRPAAGTGAAAAPAGTPAADNSGLPPPPTLPPYSAAVQGGCSWAVGYV